MSQVFCTPQNQTKTLELDYTTPCITLQYILYIFTLLFKYRTICTYVGPGKASSLENTSGGHPIVGMPAYLGNFCSWGFAKRPGRTFQHELRLDITAWELRLWRDREQREMWCVDNAWYSWSLHNLFRRQSKPLMQSGWRSWDDDPPYLPARA